MVVASAEKLVALLSSPNFAVPIPSTNAGALFCANAAVENASNSIANAATAKTLQNLIRKAPLQFCSWPRFQRTFPTTRGSFAEHNSSSGDTNALQSGHSQLFRC